MKVVFLTLGTVLVLGLFMLMAKIWGLSQQYPPLDHPLFAERLESNSPQTVMVVQIEKRADLEKMSQQAPEAWIWLNIRTTSDSQLIVTNTNEKVHGLTFETFKNSHPGVLTLAETYRDFPKTNFILNIVDNAVETHLLLIRDIKDFHPDQRTIIQSDTLSIVKALKDLKPQWLFGTSRSDLLQLLTMSSLGIAPAAQMAGDLFIAPLLTLKRPSFDANVLDEVKRRNKWRLIGPLEDDLQFAAAKKWGVEGYIFANPDLFLKYRNTTSDK